MKIVIIEDEILFSTHLSKLLCKVRHDITIEAVLQSIKESIEWFDNHSIPDIIFSDIRLSDGLSFEIFRKTRIDCPIVFTTAYEEYAIQAFSYNSIHYIQKPIYEDKLREALSKYESLKKGTDMTELMSRLMVLQGTPQNSFSTRIFLNKGNSVVPVLTENITCINTTDKMAICYMDDGTDFVLQDSIRNIVVKLDPLLFKRISRQWIINIAAIKQLHISSIGNGHLIMKPNKDIELSRDKYHQIVKEILG